MLGGGPERYTEVIGHLLDNALPRLRAQSALHTGKERRIKRWQHKEVVEAMQRRRDRVTDAMRVRRQTVEGPLLALLDRSRHCNITAAIGGRSDLSRTSRNRRE